MAGFFSEFATVALIGWTGAGFTADPGPRVQPPPPPPPAVKPCDRINCDCGPGCTCETCAGLALVRPVRPVPPIVPPPWRMADRWGQAWQHADPTFLRLWIAQRNATLRPTIPPAAPSCTGGRCGR